MIWAIITGPLRRALAWALGGLVALGGAWLAGKRNAAVRVDKSAMRGHIKTTERMQNADAGLSHDPDNLRRQLHDRPADKP